MHPFADTQLNGSRQEPIVAALCEARLLGTGLAAFPGSVACAAVLPPPAELSTTPAGRFPGYQLIREVCRGGQGQVFQGVRLATGEDVAIKVLHDHSASRPREIARFEREAAVLRGLEHPNLIALSEVGIADGRPYLVMPFVFGWPLYEYVRRNGLSIRETLELFARVCEAVHAAHLNGVIHRDIKPGNILVDDSGAPHVLDFGLAKSDARVKSQPLTEAGQFLGSLPWASPEQADPALGNVDLRTDVYSLGAVLFQLLTGAYPIDPAGTPRDVLNRIVAFEPPPPSQIGWYGRAGVGAAQARIDDDLDTIVLKCLSKERGRRYQNAGELAADIRRRLAGEAIEARRDSPLYVFRKFLRRRWLPATLILVILLGAVVGVAVLAGLWMDAVRQRQVAERQRQVSGETLAAARSMFRALSESLDKTSALEIVRSQLDDFLAKQATQPPADPAVECEFRLLVSELCDKLGDREAADEHARQALAAARSIAPADEHLLCRALARASWARGGTSDSAGTLELCRELSTLVRRMEGESSPGYVESLWQIAGCLRGMGDRVAAEQAQRAAIQASEVSGSPVTSAEYYKGFAEWLCDEVERCDEALEYHAKAVTFARPRCDPPSLAHYLHSYASALAKVGRFGQAEAVAREALRIRERAFGPTDVDGYYVYVTKGMLGRILTELGQYAEAESLLLDAERGFAGSIHPRWANQNEELTGRTCERLLRLYELWDAAGPGGGHAEKAAVWRKRLDELRPAESP